MLPTASCAKLSLAQSRQGDPSGSQGLMLQPRLGQACARHESGLAHEDRGRLR